ncbi:BREX-1 system adenine-specific DNA-methyltransferase PglX [Clostridium neuense]|uniref:site-specific DNA-methyltransferase (adenine-specific) n=1 Tax=Clostridium neuense TaxID=1728934 RepID=A0ABW8TH98_9CLOT
MNKGKLEKFAVDSRRELIAKIKIKAMQYGIEEDKIKKSQVVSSDSVIINGKPLSNEEKTQRERLLQKISYLNERGEDGYEQIVEEVTYTWFNRFTALRFMEVNNYLPTRVRALSSETPGNIEPDLIKEASNVDLPVDKQKIYDMKLNNDTEGLFKYLIIAQCNALNKSLPFMFEKIGHYTELLFPDGLLNDNAFIRNLTNIEIISEEDWQQVEIIGWLYQYYNSEEKDRVIKAKKKYKKEEIPFATQLFTPDWIVRYMVQNTLGRYWIESHPEHSDLKKNWEFYLENHNPEPDFEEKLAPYINKKLKVEEIKCFDPAMGSGHILVYMFDVLYEIYEKCGYMSREIPQLIIENNLYGLDIDDRAYQLACFAVIMKGMKYNNRLLRNIERRAERVGKEGIKLNLASIQETNNLNNDDIVYIAGESDGENYKKTKEFIEWFNDAKIYGSLINIEVFDEEFFIRRLDYIMKNPAEDIIQNESRKKVVSILPELLKQVDIMGKEYDILVTNPPYMSYKYMNSKLLEFINKRYEDVKYDLFSAFIKYSFRKVKKDGQLGFMTPFVWMFIIRYEAFREYIINHKTLSTLIQLEYSAFEEATVPICTFTIRNRKIEFYKGEYLALSEFKGANNQPIKVLEAIENNDVEYRYNISSTQFNKIPGKPIAFWASEQVINAFSSDKFERYFISESLNLTGDNAKFLRKVWEVNNDTIGKSKKWLLYAKGGGYRKWWGNLTDVVNWSPEAINHYRTDKVARIIPEYLWYKKGITWGFVTSSLPSFRVLPEEATFDIGGASVFFNDYNDYNYYLGFLNCKICEKLLKMINPTLNFQMSNIGSLPIIANSDESKEKVKKLVAKCINISNNDWDNFEISLDFKNHPIITYKDGSNKIEQAYHNWKCFSNNQFYQLKETEEELNRIFIGIYGLQDEMVSQIEENDITVRKADLEREVKSFVSYAIGCMFGRYSLDKEGIIYAGGKFDSAKYTTFKADEYNIIPMLSENYFEDDMISKFVEFVKVIFGEETLSENLEYIAETLGKKSNETAKETIRRYFLNDFYKDHLQTYKNRPIYWMFTSGKQKAFNCLIYMHRYDKTTLSRIRTDYLHELQDRLDTERKSLVDVIEGDYSTKEKSEAKKRLTQLDKQIDEIKKYDEVLHHMADMQIEIDLDDGVKVNYEKFKGLLAKIK